MRVIFNVDAITAPLTGIGHYTLQLARGLVQHSDIEELKLYSAYRWVSSPEQALDANRTIARLRRGVPLKSLALEVYTQLRALAFHWRTRRLHDHLFHTPNYVLMPFDGRAVTTVHDLSFVRYPECHPPERIIFLERHLPETLQRAQAVITDSAFVRGELLQEFGVPEQRIHTVPLGVDSEFMPRSESELQPFLAKWNIFYKKYLLVVATLEPRKNLVRLVQAYSALPERIRGLFPLVVVGARGWLSTELSRVMQPLERRGELRRLGYLSQQELMLVYSGATGFAFPSLYEGFGLPVLEAMASGVPVVTSNVASMPEIADSAALLVDPLNVDAIRMALERLIEDVLWRESAIATGLQRAKEFSWARCVEKTVDVYRHVVATT